MNLELGEEALIVSISSQFVRFSMNVEMGQPMATDSIPHLQICILYFKKKICPNIPIVGAQLPLAAYTLDFLFLNKTIKLGASLLSSVYTLEFVRFYTCNQT